MTQPQPIQRQPSLPTFLATSSKTKPQRQPSPPPRGVLGAIVVLQITSGLTLGLVLGQLLITIGFLLHPPVIPAAPVPSRSLPRFQ